jgi:hypothetical protein
MTALLAASMLAGGVGLASGRLGRWIKADQIARPQTFRTVRKQVAPNPNEVYYREVARIRDAPPARGAPDAQGSCQ